MDRPKILIQLDSDPQPSSFDGIVAMDAGVDRLLTYGGVEPSNVVGLVHGAIFTRGPKDLHRTAIFIGGSDVSVGEQLLKNVCSSFMGPFRVSVMLDSNGCNTTAAAAVVSILNHGPLQSGSVVSVLGGTGPVGRRIAFLCSRLGATVNIVSRDLERAKDAVKDLSSKAANAVAMAATTPDQLEPVLADTDILFSAGAAGVELVSAELIQRSPRIKLIVDVNAIPPLGVGGIKIDDQGIERNGRICYGALGVGGLKMKIHRRAIESLFEKNSAVIDAAEAFEIGKQVLAN